MNVIKIFLSENLSIAELKKDFPLYQGNYGAKLLNVFVPTSILAGYLETQYIDGTGFVHTEAGTFTAMKIGMTYLREDGRLSKSQPFYMRYVKTLVYNNIEWALYERKLPQAFTLFAGQGVNAPTLIANVVNMQNNNVQEGETIIVNPPTILEIITSQTCKLDVLPSTNFDADAVIDASEWEYIWGVVNGLQDQINNLNNDYSTIISDIEDLQLNKQDKIDNTLQTTSKEVTGAINELNAKTDINTNDINTLSSEVSNLGSTVETLSDNVGAIEENITTLENAVSNTYTKTESDNKFLNKDFNLLVERTYAQLTDWIAIRSNDTTLKMSLTTLKTFIAEGLSGLSFNIVAELPTEGQSNIIYLTSQVSTVEYVDTYTSLPTTGLEDTLYIVEDEHISGTTGWYVWDTNTTSYIAYNSGFAEYIWLSELSRFELIGTTQVDLTGYATETWVTSNFLANSTLNGGTTGQVLTKLSNDNLDFEWKPISVNGVQKLLDPAKSYLVIKTTTNNEQLTVLTGKTGSPSYTADMGDGTTYTMTSTNDIVHTYANAGMYVITFSGDFINGILVGGLENSNKSKYLEFYGGSNYPETISNYTFHNCINLTNAVIRNATTIGTYAFYQCPLVTLDFNRVTSIGTDAFYNCSSLREINIKKVTSIGDSAFCYCLSLPNLYTPVLVSVADNAFNGCTRLKSLTIGNLTTSGTNAFYNVTLDNLNISGTITDANITTIRNLITASGGSFSQSCEIKYGLQVDKTPTMANDVVRKTEIDTIEANFDNYEPLLPSVPDNQETKYLGWDGSNNKIWKDVAVGGGGYSAKLYVTMTPSDVSGYYKSSYSPSGTETEVAIALTSEESPKLIGNYLFDLPIDTTIIDSGTWVFVAYVKVSSAVGDTRILGRPFLRHADGTETDLLPTNVSSIRLTNTDYVKITQEYNYDAINCLVTDRLGERVYASTTSEASVTLTAIIGDGRGGYMVPPISPRHNQFRDLNGDENYQHISSTEKTKLASVEENANYYMPTGSAQQTLTVEDWAAGFNTQTITISHDTTKRNIIDVLPASINEWARCKVYAEFETEYSIRFKCTTIPTTPLYFNLIEMEVSYAS